MRSFGSVVFSAILMCSAIIILLYLPGVGYTALRDGLEAYYPFDGNGNDASGNGRNLLLLGDADIGIGILSGGLSLPTNEPNYYGTPVLNGWAEAADDPAFEFGGQTVADYTMQVWVKHTGFPLSSGHEEEVIMEHMEGGGGPGWTLVSLPGSDETGKGYLYYHDNDPNEPGYVLLENTNYIGGGGSVAPGSPEDWAHVVVRRSGNMFSLFVDGVNCQNFAATGRPVGETSQSFYLGRRNPMGNGDFPFCGIMDEVSLWSRALSDAEITMLYNDGNGYAIPMTNIPGDINGDDMVNTIDADILASNWLSGPGATWSRGDFNGDGYVNDKDATIMAANWYALSATVPEPSMGIMIISVGILLMVFRYTCFILSR